MIKMVIFLQEARAACMVKMDVAMGWNPKCKASM